MKGRAGLCLALLLAGAAQGHDGVHPAPAAGAEANLPFPVAVGGPYLLIDQTGLPRTEADPDGHLQLLFFGYASCEEICSAVLPQMAEATQALRERGVSVTPVMITVDPVRDTVAALGPALAKYGPDFIGLTGDRGALARAYAAFSIESAQVMQMPDGSPVYAHGSYMYLLDGEGRVLTLFPPILSLDRVIDLVAGYAAKG